LNNPVNDANDMKAALQGLGFNVDTVLNGGRVQMEEAIEHFKNRLSVSKNSYGFLFYAGHGVQSGGVNYLIPVDADIRSESYLGDRAVSVQAMLDEINQVGNELNVGFVRIQGGTFMMGSPSSEAERSDHEAQHRVTVSSFSMGQYEVTQREYETVMGNNPSTFKGANLPVENVSWFDAVFYCNQRSVREGLTPAYTINGENVTWNRSANGYRLPTEAEWEYACRAGTTGPFSTGNNITASQANYTGNYPYGNTAKGTYRERTTDVGSFASNPWGLYDMHGNVSEWCWDWYGGYSMADQTDPTGAASGSTRVLRGGSWTGGAQGLRSAYRFRIIPWIRVSSYGFRVVRP
jgi:formylglycine-generating enzyme required for sulfatase activity